MRFPGRVAFCARRGSGKMDYGSTTRANRIGNAGDGFEKHPGGGGRRGAWEIANTWKRRRGQEGASGPSGQAHVLKGGSVAPECADP